MERRTSGNGEPSAEWSAAQIMSMGVAHEINNALSPVILYGESLRANETSLSAQTREYLSAIEHSVRSVGLSVGRMVEFFRSGGLGPELKNASALPVAQVEPELALESGRVLVVEDERSLLTAICELLRQKGYAVTGVGSGAAALEMLAGAEFDVLLTDLVMPEMGGLELIQSVVERHPTVASVVMTAHGTIAGAVEALQAGAMDYIVKPFALAALLPMLRRALTVRRLRRENAALELSLRERAAELESANRDLESFSYSVSHDLRAPLRAIRGFADALKEDYTVSPASGGELLQRIVRGADRMDVLIAALLELSAAARQPLVRERVDMEALAHSAVAEVRTDNPAWQGQVTLAALPECEADAALVRQIWVNLLSNAVKFTRQQAAPRVELGFTTEAGVSAYFVRDNGVGFDQAQAQRAFVAFARLHPQGQFPGSGIGLSIVHRIVARHGGRIWAESQPNQGATFHFTLLPSHSG